MGAGGYGAHTWTTEIARSVRNRLVTGVPGLTTDRVFRSNYSVKDHLAFPPADVFVTMFFPNFSADQAAVSGGGVYNTPFDATMDLTVFVRLEADIENRSTQAMEDDANGADLLIQRVLTALQMFDGDVSDRENLYILRRPLRVKPGFRVEPRTGKDDSRWTVAVTSWEASFVADLTLLYP